MVYFLRKEIMESARWKGDTCVHWTSGQESFSILADTSSSQCSKPDRQTTGLSRLRDMSVTVLTRRMGLLFVARLGRAGRVSGGWFVLKM